MKTFVLLASLLVALSFVHAEPEKAAPAAPETPMIKPEEAKDYIGKIVTVKGTVVQVAVIANGTTFLNFGGKHPDETFSAVCLPTNVPKEGLKQYEGKEVSITGKIQTHKEKPQIVLESPATQIK